MKIKVGDTVASEFGTGKVVAVTKGWLIYRLGEDNEICLSTTDSEYWVPVTDHEIGQENKSVAAMNSAFAADPNAIHTLLCNRVPCNQALADDPFVQVDASPVLEDSHYQVGALGLVNAVLAANDLPLVAASFSTADDTGRPRLVGFCEYRCPHNNDEGDHSAAE
jgi:hypothetical protein